MLSKIQKIGVTIEGLEHIEHLPIKVNYNLRQNSE